jgi:hypothetical protein
MYSNNCLRRDPLTHNCEVYFVPRVFEVLAHAKCDHLDDHFHEKDSEEDKVQHEEHIANSIGLYLDLHPGL